MEHTAEHAGMEGNVANRGSRKHDEQIRQRARKLWQADGSPPGREDEYLERARELQAITDNPTAGQLPNPMIRHPDPTVPVGVEEAELQENLGEFPGRTSDQGDRPPTPMTRRKAREALRKS